MAFLIARSILSLGMFSARAAMHGGAQARVHGRVGQAELGRDGDFARQLGEQLGLDLILPPLAVHDVLELGMTGHALLLDGSRRAG